ncbi:30S ribosomal protein S9 [Plasmodium malariae]|uniref:30S ribosomal protein S9 n=1 Tax=Plasmodium malariae TaxID=5858 RepID=A0A1A8W9N9_PLAMA|nr:30S ribosomal protein S9 [Plasmodium malariae]
MQYSTAYYSTAYYSTAYYKCKGVSNLKCFNNGSNTAKIAYLNELRTRNTLKKRKEGNRRYRLFRRRIGKKFEIGKLFFLTSGSSLNKHINYKHEKEKFSLFKKKKDKDGALSNVKKKAKKVFTEEEIEELRKKAKEKLQPKNIEEDVTTTKGGKKQKKKMMKEKKKKSEQTKDIDLKDEKAKNDDVTDYIKSKEDFDKIVDLTKDLINEKEVEYIQKISSCDEELLKYDKRQKHIKLNYEDTIFDEGNYMENYVNNISKFRFDIYNIHNKNEFDRITKYLNYQYIQEIQVDVPSDKSYNIELKKYFYQVVCDLVNKNKERFEGYLGRKPGEDQNEAIQRREDEDEDEYDDENDDRDDDDKVMDDDDKVMGDDERNDSEQEEERGKTIFPSIHKGKINYNKEEGIKSQTLSNFINENEKQNKKKISVMDKIENMASIIKPTDQDIMNKYMSSDLYNLLCDIKEEYEYMFDNGGIAKFAFDQNRKTHKEKLIFSGKKKRAVAMVFLQKGNNNLIINNRDGYQYLQYQIFNLNKIFSPLLHLCMHRYFNVVAKVEGGGLSGQSVAIFHALVKYITYNFSLKIKPYFRSFKFMTVDSRKVERKKYGLKKARKKKQYSKR